MGALLFSFLTPLYAQVDSRIAPESISQLQEIQQEVEQGEEQLRALEQKFDSLERELKGEKEKLENLERTERALRRELEQTYDEEAQLSLRVGELNNQIQRLRLDSLQRIRATYMNPGISNASLFLGGIEQGSLARDSFYLSRVRLHDKELLTLLELREEELHEVQSSVQELQREKLRLLSEHQQKRSAIEDSVKKQQEIVTHLNQQKKERGERLFELQVQALRLETILSGLTNGENSTVVAREDHEGSVSHASTILPQESTSEGGEGLRKGHLLTPVDGRLARQFGKIKVNVFQDYVFQKGVEFSVSSLQNVKAVSDGIVSFVGQLPALGAVVVLDHGRRSYSVYARLDQTSVSKGLAVIKGAPLGVIGRDQNHLYFEIRQAGKAVNPQNFYKNPL
ncbi:MAG: peptidoglycan DD-metalloendopeptidase family protein [Bdellovibrionales bacterium]|nr:peptidoglycan DD-metalloendopeptidase family protein [Bdellovibrionales bacterium]